MLQAHYARNRTPKAPNPSRIRRAPSVAPPPPTQEQGGSNAASRTLSSYPPQWQEVIGYAKQSFRAYIAGTNGFPDTLTGVKEARECLDEALAVHLEDGGIVEPGKPNVNIHAPPNHLYFRPPSRQRNGHARTTPTPHPLTSLTLDARSTPNPGYFVLNSRRTSGHKCETSSYFSQTDSPVLPNNFSPWSRPP